MNTLHNFTLPERDPWGIKTGKFYTPFINVYESGSIGTLHRIHCPLTHRDHHYLSLLEADYHYVVQLLDDVVDIREQYAIIPVERTHELAKQLRVPHPRKGGELFEVTVDLMLTILRADGDFGYVARSCKYVRDLRKQKVLNRQALEYASVSDKQIPWKVVTELMITPDMAARARWLFLIYKTRPRYNVDTAIAKRFIETFSKQDLVEPLRIVLANTASACHMPAAEALALFRHLVCTRQLKVDLTYPLSLKDPHLPLVENFR